MIGTATGCAGTTTIGIEWELRRLGRRPCHGHRYGEDAVGTQLGFGMVPSRASNWEHDVSPEAVANPERDGVNCQTVP
jgi:hypothetical protein